uniref:Uncharacterized protein n=1 Tax=Solanum tuberosum TaxID=4113 RepID=M1AXH2_SOLTU
MNEDGGILNLEPGGFISDLFGEKASGKLPLHDAVRRELADRELATAPLLERLSMLANLCIGAALDVGAGKWIDPLTAENESLSLLLEVSCSLEVLFPVSSTGDIGAGTKNLALPAVAGFMEGTEGDWNRFVGLPPPLLNVSTYLPKEGREASQVSLF